MKNGRSWRGSFHVKRRIVRRAFKLRRLQAKGMLPPTDKASLRKAAEEAVGQATIRKFPAM
jgi:hypothetical protein